MGDRLGDRLGDYPDGVGVGVQYNWYKYVSMYPNADEEKYTAHLKLEVIHEVLLYTIREYAILTV